MMRFTLKSRFAAIALSAGLCSTFSSSAARKLDFNSDIRPLLSDRCFACHGPDAKKVKGNLRLDQPESATKAAKSGKIAVVSGQPSESELVRRILSSDPEELMPPPETHKPLTAADKEVLKRWIQEGGQYQGHWAYTSPVKASGVPSAQAIDHLVRVRLSEQGLAPAPPADRRTLIRRVSFDLVGLPPTPAEITAFEGDTSQDAYQHLVDRLLASPHFGERMAIGWLDIVRFADTIGYHSDNPRNIWPYRDYVIGSFNQNKPFDQFTREQIAGDLLPNPSLDQRVASAFNRLLLTTEEGGAQSKDYEARYLTDRVRAIGAVWLGQTIGCAQCHDHKFDPFTSRDFYSMGAFFADVKETIIGRREDGLLVPNEAQAPELDRVQRLAMAAQADYDGTHEELNPAFQRWVDTQKTLFANEQRWTRIAPAAAEAVSGTELKVNDDGSIVARGKNPEQETYRLRFTNRFDSLAGFRLEALPDDAFPSHGPGRGTQGRFIVSGVSVLVGKPGEAKRSVPLKSAHATLEESVPLPEGAKSSWSANSIVNKGQQSPTSGWAVVSAAGKPQQLVFELDEALSVPAGEEVVIELSQQFGKAGDNLGRFRFSTSADRAAASSVPTPPPPGEVADILKSEGDITAKLRSQFKQRAEEFGPWRQRLEAANKAKNEFEVTVPRCLVTERSGEPRPVRILPRGNFLVETGELVSPALPAFLARQSDRLPGKSPDRLDLANWLVSRENPLTARVTMNRLWKQFFGIGLSKVLDDLGSQGEPPRNQPLLDWLACEFMDSGWDLKHMVRLIVLSNTYQQSSSVPRESLTRDPENRELARQGRWRLDAELVRDNALSIAGLISPEIGGPSVRPYQPDGYWENLNFPQRGYDASPGSAQYRRGLYTWWQRSFLHPSLVAFDAPSREECAADRNRSNIPQQALVLLNDPTYVEAARAFATRILRESQGSPEERLRWAWSQAVGRFPSDQEVLALRSLLEKHLAEFGADHAAAEKYVKTGLSSLPSDLDAAVLAAWTDVARALLNLHETITRS
jgi:Protein of unknown function (DUF1553)/Protein of unknown function (DUF1549)/Planctomycete cytochrome C